MGQNPEKGEVLQTVIWQGNWFAAEISNKAGYALIGCTVAPGFDFKDFELAVEKELIERSPEKELIIKRLT
jgi:hypothetical protein